MNTSAPKWSELFLFPGHKKIYFFILLFLVGTSTFGAILPHYIHQLSLSYGHPSLYYQKLLFLLIIFSCIFFTRIGYQFTINSLVRSLVQHSRMLCFKNWMTASDRGLDGKGQDDKYPLGEIIARMMGDTLAIRELMTSGTFGLLIDIFFVFSSFIGLLTLHQKIGPMIGGIEFIAAALLVWGGGRMREVFNKLRVARGKVSAHTANILGGMEEGFYNQTEKYASKTGEKIYNQFLETQLAANNWDASYYSLAECLYPLLLAALILLLPFVGMIEAAFFLVVMDFIQRSIDPLKSATGKVAGIQRAMTGLTRIRQFVEHFRPGPLEIKKEGPSGAFLGLEVKDIVFDYRELKNSEGENIKARPFSLGPISFVLKAGESIGVVGESGGGKSTLLKILSGQLIPSSGNMLLKYIEGERSGLEKVGLVTQDSHIFSESFYFNIALNFSSPSKEFLNFFEMMREKLDYLKDWEWSKNNEALKEKIDVKKLSSGQKQLICALRSCYLKKDVVLFDEISSGLDSRLEKNLRKLITLIQGQAGMVIVAHRLETIQSCREIYLMEKGQFVAHGPAHQLAKESPLYQKFIAQIS